MVVDGLEVLLVQFPGQRGEQGAEALGVKAGGTGVSDLPQPAQQAGEQLQRLDGPAQGGVGGSGEDAAVDPLAAEDRLDRHVVHVPGDRRVLQAVRQDMLAVGDRAGVRQAGEHAAPGHLEQELVAAGHRVKQGVQPEVLGERGDAVRQIRCHVEVPARVHQERLHRAIRSLSVS